MNAAAVLGLVVVAGVSSWAEATKNRWDSAEELREWISTPDRSAVEVVAQSEDGRTFLRAVPGKKVSVSLPQDSPDAGDTHGAQPVLDPRHYNAIRVTLRHSMTITEFGGFWYHAGQNYDESMVDMPFFDEIALPGDGEWHTATLRLWDSPYFVPDEGVVFIQLGPAFSDVGNPAALAAFEARLQAVPDTAYLDLDEIEFIWLDEPAHPVPTITGVRPGRAKWLQAVRIDGHGFAVPASKNVVLFDDVRAEVVEGDESHLVARATSSGTVTIRLRTPGGGKATAGTLFHLVGPPVELEVVAGDGQTGPVGAVLEPLSVRASDGSLGVPGEIILFSITKGSGSLSVTEATSDEDGLAETVLTLGNITGGVTVEARLSGIDPVAFRVTAVP